MPKHRYRSSPSPSIMEAAERARILDLLRQEQIGLQLASITRLLDDPSASRELSRVNNKLAIAIRRIAELEEREMGRRKDAFYAGFSAGETEDSVDESWETFRDGEEDDGGEAAAAEPEPEPEPAAKKGKSKG